MATLPSISDLNKASDKDFKNAVCILFELAPPLEKRLIPKRPFTSYQSLIDSGRKEISSMSLEEKNEVLCGHPAIGQKKGLSKMSTIEQGGDEPEEVYLKLAQLNKEYLDHYGFPFVIFVNGRPKSQICEILDGFMKNKDTRDKESELNRALNDLFLIAEDRLKKATIKSSL